MVEDRCQRLQQIRLAAAVGTGADERGKTLLLLQVPFAAKLILKTGLQAAKSFGVGDFQAKQLHEILTSCSRYLDAVVVIIVTLRQTAGFNRLKDQIFYMVIFRNT